MSDEDPNQQDLDQTIPTDFSAAQNNPDTLPTMNVNLGPGDTVAMDGAPTTSARVGTPEIPGYEIVRMLGEGGMGMVYEARQLALDRIVALKVLKPAVAQEPEFRERFLRESAAAGKVAHANVVQIYDAGEANGHLYMTFQLINGGDLSDLIKDKGALSEFKALSILKDCLIGLQAIYEAGLVHRDIKPGNIFMENGRRAVIGDLGLARQTSGDDRMTMTGAAMGTPSYMSPEHIQGIADIDIRTDIYAFGSTLYKMITGAEPFQGETVYAITHSIISQPIPDPRELNASLSMPIVGIIKKSMAKERDQRYQTPEQFLQDVEAALSGHQLIHAEGFGNIQGVERTETPAAEKPSSPVTMGKSRPSASFLTLYAKPLVAVFVIGWFVVLLNLLKVDTTRYEPDWANTHGSDQYGRFVTLRVGNQIQKLRLVKGGDVLGHVVLGADPKEPGYQNHEKLHSAVMENDIWLADSEVTQAFWLELMDENPSEFENSYFPVQNVNYADIQLFFERLRELFNEQYDAPFIVRLPNQIEWEHACRAGVEYKMYGDQDVINGIGLSAQTPLAAEWEKLLQDETLSEREREAQAWEFIADDLNDYGPKVVKQLQANRWGLFDMIGNVAEWCSDDWDGESNHQSSDGSGAFKVVHGGSWFHHPNQCRSGYRMGLEPEDSPAYVGFRFVVELPRRKQAN